MNASQPTTTRTVTLDDKIRAARQEGRRYIPNQAEWERATQSQRKGMTWPAYVIALARRSA